MRNPNFTLTTDDRTAIPVGNANGYGHLAPGALAIRVFDRLEGSAEVLLYDSYLASGLGGFTDTTLLAQRLSQFAQ